MGHARHARSIGPHSRRSSMASIIALLLVLAAPALLHRKLAPRMLVEMAERGDEDEVRDVCEEEL